MKYNALIILKSFLLVQDNIGRFTKYLDQDLVNQLDAVNMETAFSAHFFSLKNIVSTIHYSWIIALLENLENSQEKALFVACLDDPIREKVSQNLPLQRPLITLSPIGKKCLQKQLLHLLLGKNCMPIAKELLPKHPLNIFVEFSKNELIECINFLALFDLSIELKKTVATKTIKQIHSYLLPEQKKFLQKIASYKEPFSFSQFLHKWDGTKDNFQKLLHKRGLYRFAAGLHGLYPDLLWYIFHHLDTGRARILQKMCEKKVNPILSNSIQSHILEIGTLIRKNS